MLIKFFILLRMYIAILGANGFSSKNILKNIVFMHFLPGKNCGVAKKQQHRSRRRNYLVVVLGQEIKGELKMVGGVQKKNLISSSATSNNTFYSPFFCQSVLCVCV